MINNYEKRMLEQSLKFLDINKSEPINLSRLQQIINHASEEFYSLDEVDFKYVVENPEDENKLIFGVTDFEFIEELNSVCFKTQKGVTDFTLISKKPLVKEADVDSVLSLTNIQQVIDSLKDKEDWGLISINIEKLFYPNMYLIGNGTVYIKLGETN
jgi:hypothetical protein